MRTLNAAGTATFFARSFAGSDAQWSGLWKAPQGGPIELIARTGSSAPGIAGNFSGFGFIALGDGERVVFQGSADGGEGIWRSGDNGELELVAGSGVAVDGTGARLDAVGEPRTNGAGDVLFRAGLAGTGAPEVRQEDEGIFLARPNGDIETIVLAGDPVPNLIGVSFLALDRPLLNGWGDVAFTARLDDGRVALVLGRGGTLVTVAVSGELFEIASGVFEPIASIALDTRPSFPTKQGERFFNDRGELAYLLRFATPGADCRIRSNCRSAIVVARLPEPAVVLLLAGAAVLLPSVRRPD